MELTQNTMKLSQINMKVHWRLFHLSKMMLIDILTKIQFPSDLHEISWSSKQNCYSLCLLTMLNISYSWWNSVQ